MDIESDRSLFVCLYDSLCIPLLATSASRLSLSMFDVALWYGGGVGRDWI